MFCHQHAAMLGLYGAYRGMMWAAERSVSREEKWIYKNPVG